MLDIIIVLSLCALAGGFVVYEFVRQDVEFLLDDSDIDPRLK